MKPRLLIVDDSSENIMILARALEDLVEATFAMTGEEALELVAKAEPAFDLVLLDVAMPGIDGHEVCRRLKDDPATKRIPVIFVTASYEIASERKGLEVGAEDYIIKPFSIDIVRARVRTHLELKRRTDLLERVAGIDALTGLANRQQFDQALAGHWAAGSRSGDPLGMILVEVERFGEFKSTYGAHDGERCVQRVAEVLPEGDAALVARLQEAQFGVLVPGADDARVQELAEQIRQRVDALAIPHPRAAAAGHVTVACATASRVPTGDGAAAFLRDTLAGLGSQG